MSDPGNGNKRPRASHLRWIRIGDMRVSPKAQREFRKAHAESLAADFDLEGLGYPVVNHRGSEFWIIDGQHRVAALKLNGFDDDDRIQCETYEGLTEAEEAEMFLRRDERKRIGTFDRFRISLVAHREEESDIERIVRAQGYKIARGKGEGCISAVGALRFAYGLGPATLGRAVRILGGAFNGNPDGFSAELIQGMALVCQRYDGQLDEDRAVTRLAQLAGGTITLQRKSYALKVKTGHRKDHCVAAAIVETLNGGRGGQKMESWWQ
jgi:hypothetical protein